MTIGERAKVAGLLGSARARRALLPQQYADLDRRAARLTAERDRVAGEVTGAVDVAVLDNLQRDLDTITAERAALDVIRADLDDKVARHAEALADLDAPTRPRPRADLDR